MKEFTKSGDLTSRVLHLGCVQRFGPHVSLFAEHGVYQLRRHPAHPCGHKVAAVEYLVTARKLAKAWASETTA